MPVESEFAAAVDSWSLIFGAVAGAAASLVGLLSVSLALNPTVMGVDRPAGLRVWAGPTFQNFLMVLVIALVALIPEESPAAMAITVGTVGATGLFRVASDARKTRTDADPQWRTSQALTRFFAPMLAYLISVWAAIQIWGGHPDALDWMMSIVFLLTISAVASSWDLLKAMRERGGS